MLASRARPVKKVRCSIKCEAALPALSCVCWIAWVETPCACCHGIVPLPVIMLVLVDC
jgi:hypothetical protein